MRFKFNSQLFTDHGFGAHKLKYTTMNDDGIYPICLDGEQTSFHLFGECEGLVYGRRKIFGFSYPDMTKVMYNNNGMECVDQKHAVVDRYVKWLEIQSAGILFEALCSCKVSGCGFSKDFSKVMTILANEVIIAGPIRPAINIWLAHKGQQMILRSLAGSIEPGRYI